MTSARPSPSTRSAGVWVVLGLFVVALGWAYWTTFVNLVAVWRADAQASAGFIVPILAAVVLYFRRPLLAVDPSRGAAWGVPLLLLGAVCRLLEARFFLPWFGPFSLLPTLAGVILLTGGWPMFRWAWPAVCLLGFMLPLPYNLEVSVAQPLQQLATIAATYTLQTIGYPAVAEGNVILIDDHRIGVLQACNGLGMLVAFFALSTAMAIVLDHRPWLDRAVVFFSAVPIAVLMNLGRIAVTAVTTVTLGRDIADGIVHDVAGLLMPICAFVVLWLELKLFDRLYRVPPTAPEPSAASELLNTRIVTPSGNARITKPGEESLHVTA